MTDSEVIFILFSNILAGASLFGLLVLFFYIRRIKFISNPRERRRNWIVGGAWLIFLLTVSVSIFMYGNVKYMSTPLLR